MNWKALDPCSCAREGEVEIAGGSPEKQVPPLRPPCHAPPPASSSSPPVACSDATRAQAVIWMFAKLLWGGDPNCQNEACAKGAPPLKRPKNTQKLAGEWQIICNIIKYVFIRFKNYDQRHITTAVSRRVGKNTLFNRKDEP